VTSLPIAALRVPILSLAAYFVLWLLASGVGSNIAAMSPPNFCVHASFFRQVRSMKKQFDTQSEQQDLLAKQLSDGASFLGALSLAPGWS
jgi:hypothetical protein